MSKVALYTRVSTRDQTTQQQLDQLRAWAERAGHEVSAVYEDRGISGAKGRDKRPGFDRMLKAATRREFDTLAVWSSDRISRSMPDLIETLQTIRGAGLGLYIHTQALDTNTPSGRALYQMLGVFSELEREMIVARVNAGMERAARHGTRSGKPIGRPRASEWTPEAVCAALLTGLAVRKVAKQTGASPGTVHAMRVALVAEGKLSASQAAA